MLTDLFRRQCTTIAAALLVVIALLHCAGEPIFQSDSGNAASWSAPTGDTAPHRGCENETGCICRGATLAHRVDLSDLQPVACDWLLATGLASQPGLATADATVEPGAFDDPSRLPPISGRMLRARYSSLVI